MGHSLPLSSRLPHCGAVIRAAVMAAMLMGVMTPHSVHAAISFPDPITPVPGVTQVKAQMNDDTLLVGCYPPTSVTVIDDLNGDDVNEVVVGCANQGSIVVVKFTEGRASSTAATQIKALITTNEIYNIPVSTTGLDFGRVVDRLNYDFDGDNANDFVASARGQGSDGGLVILCLNADFQLGNHYGYAASSWCPSCQWNSPFPAALASYRVLDQKCLLVTGEVAAGGQMSTGVMCGMTKTNPIITDAAKSLQSNNYFADYINAAATTTPDLYYNALTNIGDVNDDKVDDLICRHSVSSDANIIALFILPGLRPGASTQSPPVHSGYDVTVTTDYAFMTAAPGDLNEDGVPDAAVADAGAMYFLYMNKDFTVKLVPSLKMLIAAPEVVYGGFSFSRVGGRSTLYAYYIDKTDDAISSIDVGTLYFPSRSCGWEEIESNPWKEFPTFEMEAATNTKVKKYFAGRSKQFSQLEDAYVGYEEVKRGPTTGTARVVELRVRGRGNKLNVVTVPATTLATVEKITLQGHPAGMTIINVEGGGEAAMGGVSVVYADREGTETGVGSGRVLVHLAGEGALTVAGAEGSTTAVSILAPLTDVKVESGTVKGNVVAKTLEVAAEAAVEAQPFGAAAKRGGASTPRAPKAGAGTGSAQCPQCAKCVWGAW